MSAHSIANNTEKPSLRSESFQFPYQAYPIQVQMMNAVYEALREQKIGLFESPTGTVCMTISNWAKYAIFNI
jgi:Rad3-related DNA helicase